MNYAVIGGTGTLGREIVRQLLARDPATRIEIFSRDELKQRDMQASLVDYPNLRFRLGDVRDREAMTPTMAWADAVFHVAALKHVDLLEANPLEAIKTNILGTVNAAQVAVECGVGHFVFSSTDKAVAPVNVYGHTKALGEKILLGRNLRAALCSTHFSVFRWANVIGSRGSVLDLFARSLKEHRRLDITDVAMTRFWIRIEDAVTFMLKNYESASRTDVMIPPMKAASVLRLGAAVARALGIKDYDVSVVGVRPGEKFHEEIAPGVTSDTAAHYSDDELEALVAPLVQRTAAA